MHFFNKTLQVRIRRTIFLYSYFHKLPQLLSSRSHVFPFFFGQKHGDCSSHFLFIGHTANIKTYMCGDPQAFYQDFRVKWLFCEHGQGNHGDSEAYTLQCGVPPTVTQECTDRRMGENEELRCPSPYDQSHLSSSPLESLGQPHVGPYGLRLNLEKIK